MVSEIFEMAVHERFSDESVTIVGTGKQESKTSKQRALRAALLAGVCSVGGPSVAGYGATDQGATMRVIELFTSQGCPKCPPADQLVTAFARQPRTIALSFAVNYWDYIGWKDTLASPAFTQRQHAYAAARGDRRIFTPQAIIDGIGVEPGADEAAILRDTVTLAGRDGAMSVPLTLTETDGTLHIDIGAKPNRPKDGAAGVYVLRVARAKTVRIDRGANSGRSVTYTNVVRAISRIGDWAGKSARFDILELKGDDEGYVVLLQTGTPDRPGAILAAAKTADL